MSTDTLSAEFEIGQTAVRTPREYALLFSGQVVQMDEDEYGVSMQVADRSEKRQVRVDPRAKGAVLTVDAEPAREDTVTVVGFPEPEGSVRAMGVDVWQGKQWATWYQQATRYINLEGAAADEPIPECE